MANKTCKCGEEYHQYTTLQNKCPRCLAEQARKKRITQEKKEKKEERRKIRQLKEKVKSRGQWAKEAQAAFNRYIRVRDKGKPCVSCGKPDDGSHQRHASHYRSVGACSSLRFNTWNVHASCMQCNSILSGNLIEYRIRLRDRIGNDRVEWLESNNEITRYDVNYLKRIKMIFNKLAKVRGRV